ncbi:hypothetical protein Dimus_039431 [Dionaea muscipula]
MNNMTTNIPEDKHMGSESVRLLRQNNVGVVIHYERDFNALCIPHEQENGLKETLRKGKGKMPMGKENIAPMNGKNKASSKEKGKAPMDKENVAPMDSNNNGISKAAQAQRARREREKLERSMLMDKENVVPMVEHMLNDRLLQFVKY